MEDFLKEFDVPPKHPSEEAVRKWRNAVAIIRSHRRRFRHVADLEKRSHEEAQLSRIREGLRVSFLSIKAATRFMDTHSESYTLEEMLYATDGFSDENVIAEGALGKVYKGKLTSPLIIQRYAQGDVLQMEISTLKKLEHKNIVSFFGFCDENNANIIIHKAYHGTLNQHLSDPILTWSKRLKICSGVARALNHIHCDIIHCDINSSKIILDKDWEPKIYGFELSTEYPRGWMHRLRFSSHFQSNILTPKYDVYCFGVLLLEVLCGRKPKVTNGGIQEARDIDPNLRKQMDTQSLRQFKNIAYKCLKQQHLERPTMDQIVKELEEALELQKKHENIEHPIAADDEGESCNSLEISLSKIRRATNGFDKAYWVGSGGYAEVYKAQLDFLNIQSFSSTGRESKDEAATISKTVAIKRILSRTDEQGKQGFLTEIDLLKCCKHRNIVSLLGFSREDDEMILVYEYAFKGSLSDYLVSGDKTAVNLTWAQRIQICLDIAHGINYLHNNMEGKPRIIHRDIKSDNILLDENLMAKIADFGLSISHSTIQQHSSVYTKNIAGTKFYMDPEYSTTGKYKRESDIYSFGVVLFEVLSGRVAYDSIFTNEDGMGLASIAKRRYEEGTLKELIDPEIIEEDDDHIFTLNRGPNQDSFHTFSKIAYQCLANTQAKRPTIEVVTKELQNALELQGETLVLSRFQYGDIKLATNNFAERYCIGLDTKGNKVYKAELKPSANSNSSATDWKNSSEPRILVAIKHITSSQGKQGFLAELEMGTIYKHPSIISLLGFCDEGDEMTLVYEYAPRRSLDNFLKFVEKIDTFTWIRRLRMCLEIARGLNHLHTKILIPYGHIKSANIQLGKNWEAKIAYFGSSKLHPSNQEIGMKVYEDPEYETTGTLIRESDIYSFGVVLFEIFCGRLAYDSVYIKENDKGLAHIARRCFSDGTIEKIIDPSLKEERDEDIFTLNRGVNQDSLDTFLKIADQCLGEAVQRPSMEMVIKELERALNSHETFLKKLQISLKDIISATENFSEINCIGSGRFWKVYKGELPSSQDNANANVSRSTIIAAKHWDSKFGRRDHQFRTESKILFKCRHENIIGLVGYCNELNEKIIVYEHMPNGSLDKYLNDANLTWIKRLKISIDVASGLEYLHQDVVTRKKVVHKGIKSSSILLNDVWKAKIANLELSSSDSLHQDMEHVSDNAYATFGYLDPQDKQGFLTEKSDIYSFGVVLFEILCGMLAWAEDSKHHAQSLGPVAKRCYEDGRLDEIVFDGIKEQIGPQSLATFADIAYQCLHDKSEERPTACEVVIQLNKALDVQNDYELWEARVHEDYKEIVQLSKNPEIYSTAKRKDLYDILSKGILIQDGKVWVSLGSNGEGNKMVSASQFSYEDQQSHKWLCVPESRFDKIAEMLDISNLNIQIWITSQFLSSGVNYGVYLVFKFCGARSTAKRMYVNLTYKMGNETFHAYFATWREDEWMAIELYRFLNPKESVVDLEFLLESFSKSYCGNGAIYVEGIEFQAIDNVKPAVNNLKKVQVLELTSNMDPIPQLATNDIPFDICSVFTQTLLKLFSWRNREKKYYMLSAKEALCDSFNAKLFNLKPSTNSRFQKVAELLSTQVFRIKCKIDSKMLLQNTEYGCYLVFKLSEKRCGLHCPVIVRDLHQRKNKHAEVVYFRSPRPWNIHDFSRVSQDREDGWMEVYIWKFKTNYELENGCSSINLKFVTYEGTMSGLNICGLEFRPM